jgi:hypothetical protein
MTSEEDPHGHLSQEPCSACSWSPYRQGHCGYKSDVKLVWEAGTHGYWELGSKYILKDRDMVARNDADNHEFIRSNTTIPVPKILAFWEQPGDRFMMIEEVIEGEESSIKEAWPSLSESDREDIAQQTADYIKQLRSHTKEKVQSIKGGPVCSNMIFKARSNDSRVPWPTHGPFESDDELFEAMTAHLTKKNLPEKVLAALREHMPPSKPYTFTNTFLDWSVIILKGKKVVGFTEWAHAAYLPCWAESIFAQWASDEGDLEWRKYLVPKLDRYHHVEHWFKLLHILEKYPELDDHDWDILKKVEAVADYEAEKKSTKSATGGL